MQEVNEQVNFQYTTSTKKTKPLLFLIGKMLDEERIETEFLIKLLAEKQIMISSDWGNF